MRLKYIDVCKYLRTVTDIDYAPCECLPVIFRKTLQEVINIPCHTFESLKKMKLLNSQVLIKYFKNLN